MPSILKLKAKAAEKRAEAQKILDAVAGESITRDMNPDEKAKFDGLMAEVATIKSQMASMKALEDDEAAEETEEEAEAATRSIRRSKAPGEAPAVHTAKRPYSICRALRLAADQKPIDGLEGEISREIEKRKGEAPKTLYLPSGSNPEIRALMNPGVSREIRRDLTTTTGAGSIFNVPEGTLIELLRAKLVVRELGATVLTDMKGTFSIIRQNSKSTVYWLGEGNPATSSQPGYDQVPFVPKVAIDVVPISRQLLNQSSLDAETAVKDDLSNSMAREVDRVAINGTGATQPLGLLQNSLVLANSAGLALGANGGPMSYAAAVQMESQVASYNADRGKLAYLTNPALRGTLKGSPKIPGGAQAGYPIFVYEDGTVPGVGMINGYPAYTTTNVPANLIKGTGVNLKAIIYGNWQDLVVAEWEGIDCLVNPYTAQSSGAVLVSLMVSMDVQVKHPESFAVITDAQ